MHFLARGDHRDASAELPRKDMHRFTLPLRFLGRPRSLSQLRYLPSSSVGGQPLCQPMYHWPIQVLGRRGLTNHLLWSRWSRTRMLAFPFNVKVCTVVVILRLRLPRRMNLCSSHSVTTKDLALLDEPWNGGAWRRRQGRGKERSCNLAPRGPAAALRALCASFGFLSALR